MQMLSRDSTRPESNKKSLNKNGNTFCCELLNRTGLQQCVITAWKLKFRGSFWTFYIQGMNFSSFQAMEPKNEPS